MALNIPFDVTISIWFIIIGRYSYSNQLFHRQHLVNFYHRHCLVHDQDASDNSYVPTTST